MNQKLLRGIGIHFLLDGTLTFFFGHRYVRLFRFGGPNNPYEKAMGALLDLSSWQLRIAGAAEFVLGLALIRKVPLKVQTLYRLVAPGYAAIDPGWRKWLYSKAHTTFDQTLAENLNSMGSVLDLGCGAGANLARIKSLGLPFTSYTGVDLSNDMLELAKEKLGGDPNVVFRQLDLISDPLPNGPFDLIVSTWVYEHLPDPVLVSEKAWERLKSGGHMILLFEAQTPSPYSRLVNWFYPIFSGHLLRVEEYRRFPGQIILEKHFWGPLGDLALLVLEKQ